MRKRNRTETEAQKVLVDTNEAALIFSLGTSTINRVAEKADAVVRIGRIKRFNVERLREYLLNQ